MAELKTISLTALRKKAGRVELDGETYDVLDIPGDAMQVVWDLAEAMQEFEKIPEDERTPDKAPNVLGIFDAAALCVPSMPEKKVKSLTPEMTAVILGIASGKVDKVEKLVQSILEKNGNGSGAPKGEATRRSVTRKVSTRSAR